MCIIILKKVGVEMPSRAILEQCFKNNPHGAGFMFAVGKGKTAWQKGFMDFEDFYKAVELTGLTKKNLAAFHFRISTAGGISQGNCHPFPIVDKAEELTILSGNAENIVMHNGCINNGRGNLSDTMIYTKDVLFNLVPTIKDKRILKAIEATSRGSRLLIFTPEFYYKTGTWIDDKETGLTFSNDTWKAPVFNWSANWKDTDAMDDGPACPFCWQPLTDKDIEENCCSYCFAPLNDEPKEMTEATGETCPFCKSEFILESGPDETGSGRFYCEDCGETWRTVISN